MTKLEELLISLNGHDLLLMRRYLASPYFNQNPKAEKLFSVLTTSDKFNTRKENYHKVFGSNRFNEKQMRYAESHLCSHIENFLTFQFLESNDLSWYQMNAKVAALKGNKKSFQYYDTLIDKKNKSVVAQDIQSLYKHFETSLTKFEVDTENISLKKIPDMSTVIHHLDVYYVAHKLQLMCAAHNMQQITGKEIDIALSHEIISISETSLCKENDTVKLYYHIYLMITKPNEERHYHLLKELVKKIALHFPVREQKDIYQYLKNYCIRKINSGQSEFLSELFHIYELQLANKKLLRHNYLTQWEFKNIVSVALRIGKTKWCKTFIAQHKRYLPTDEQKNASVYNSANIAFHDKEYRQALKYFSQSEFKEPFYQLDVRAIQLKIFFETDEYETLFYHASAFRNYLSRSKHISTFQKTIYRKLISFSIAIARNIANQKKLQSLKKEIAEATQVADKIWLLRQLSDIEG